MPRPLNTTCTHQFSAEGAVLTPISHCEFRSLAHLQVYPFGPRFLLFTVRNTHPVGGTALRRGGQDLFLERHSRPLEQTSAFAGNNVDRRPTRGRHLVWPRGLNFLCRNRCAPAARPGFTESLDKLRLFPRDFEATLTQLVFQQRDCEGVQVQVCATTAHAPHEEAACDYLR